MKKSITILFLALLCSISYAQKNDQKEKISQIVSGLQSKDLISEKENAHNSAKYIANEIDWSALYSTKQWSETISFWVYLHTSIIKDFSVFRNDFEAIGNKINDPAQYSDFVGEMADCLIKQNKEDYIKYFADLVRASGKIENYNGVLANYIQATPGTQAPDLIIEKKDKNTVLKSNELANGNYTKTMLLFYATGCGPCENLLQKLPTHLENIEAKGVRLITISGDEDEKVFKDKAKNFQWKDVFCDYNGMRGANFENFAIIGTPTIFLIDHNGKILLRTSYLEEILGYINNPN